MRFLRSGNNPAPASRTQPAGIGVGVNAVCAYPNSSLSLFLHFVAFHISIAFCQVVLWLQSFGYPASPPQTTHGAHPQRSPSRFASRGGVRGAPATATGAGTTSVGRKGGEGSGGGGDVLGHHCPTTVRHGTLPSVGQERLVPTPRAPLTPPHVEPASVPHVRPLHRAPGTVCHVYQRGLSAALPAEAGNARWKAGRA